MPGNSAKGALKTRGRVVSRATAPDDGHLRELTQRIASLVGGQVVVRGTKRAILKDGKPILELAKTPVRIGAHAEHALVLRQVVAPTEDAAVTPDAFDPGPRARAILRGREIAAKDLKDSGGAFELDDVRKLLNGISRQRVDQLVKSGDLLAVPGPSNARRYPVVQFDGNGDLISGLKDVQAVLPTKNPWAVLNFLVHPDDRLQGKRPIELLRKGNIAAVVKAAAHMAEAGA